MPTYHTAHDDRREHAKMFVEILSLDCLYAPQADQDGDQGFNDMHAYVN